MKIKNLASFTSGIGCYFRHDETFTVTIVGTEQHQARHDKTGSVIWFLGLGSTFVAVLS